MSIQVFLYKFYFYNIYKTTFYIFADRYVMSRCYFPDKV